MQGFVAALGDVTGDRLAHSQRHVVAVGKDAQAHHVAEGALHQGTVDLVEGEPVAYEAPILGEERLAVAYEEVDEVAVGPAAALGERIGQLVVANGHHGLDAAFTTELEHAAVEVESRLAGSGIVAVGEDARPLHAHAVAPKAHLGKELDVLVPVVVEVHGLVAGVPDVVAYGAGDAARLAHGSACDHVGDRWALAALVPTALVLVGGGGPAPEEVLGESGDGCVVGVWHGRTSSS